MSILLKVKELIYNLFNSKDQIFIASIIPIKNAFLFLNKVTIKFIILMQLYLLSMTCGLLDVILVKLLDKLLVKNVQLSI